MKARLAFLLACSCISSCAMFKVPPIEYPPYTARGCQLDSLKVQSAEIFRMTAKSRHYPPEWTYTHTVYEVDSLIKIAWLPENDPRAGGGIIVTISKKDCKVISQYTFQ